MFAAILRRVDRDGLIVDEVKVWKHGAAAAVVGDGLIGVVKLQVRL